MKLASFQEVSQVENIEGADNIVKITVDGHQLVTQKSNNLQIGSIVVYFPVDAMLPKGSSFDWLSSNEVTNKYGWTGYRITPIKRRGIISDGLCLPLKYFEETGMCKILSVVPNDLIDYSNELKFYSNCNKYPIKKDIDLSEALGVFKYEI